MRSSKRSKRPSDAEVGDGAGDAEKDEPRGAAGTEAARGKAGLWRGLGLVSLSGVLCFLAFPGFDLWPLSFVTFVPMLFAMDAWAPVKERTAVLLAIVFGLVAMAGGFYWLVGMLETFSGFPAWACVLFATVLWIWQGAPLSILAWVSWRASRRGWPLLLAAPAALAAGEAFFPMLFPQFMAAFFHEQPALLQIADLGGPTLVSALVVAINVAVFQGVRALLERRPFPWRASVIAAGLLAATLVYGVVRIGQVDARVAEAPALGVGLVQANMGLFQKREDRREGLRRHIEQSLAIEAEHETDLLVWPESAVAAFIREDDVAHILEPVESPVLFGGLRSLVEGGEQRHYNTAFLASRDGEVLGTYDKIYLLAFGEYLPFGDLFPILYEWSPNSGRFTPGGHVQPLPFRDGWRITTLICYEDILPGFVRNAVNEGDPHLLVNITNDAWFGDTTEPWEHLALAKLRAVEHHRYLVRATNSGVSAVIDPVGRTVTHGGVMTRESLHAEVRMMEGWTVYRFAGDWPAWIGIGLVILVAFVRRRDVLLRRGLRRQPERKG